MIRDDHDYRPPTARELAELVPPAGLAVLVILVLLIVCLLFGPPPS